MDWAEKSSSKKSFYHILTLLIVLDTPAILELPFRLIAELQILSIFYQINTYDSSDLKNSSFSTLDFIDIDSKLSSYAVALGFQLVSTLLYIYMIGVLLVLILRFCSIRKEMVPDQTIEYNLLLFHSAFACHYLNVILFRELKDSIDVSSNLIGLWVPLIVLNNVVGALGARFSAILLRNANSCAMRTHSHCMEGWIFKLVDVLIRTFLLENARLVFRLVLGLVFLVKRSRTLSLYEFYDFSTQKIFWVVHGIQLGFFGGALVQTVTSLSINFCFFVSLIISAVMVWCITSYQEVLMVALLSKPLNRLKAVWEFDSRYNVVDYVIKKGCNINSSYKTSLCQLLLSTVLNANLQRIARKLQQEEISEISRLKFFDYAKIIHHLGDTLRKEIYQAYLARFPKSRYLKLSSAWFYIQDGKEHKYSTIINLMSLSNLKGEYEISILAQKLLNRIYKATFDKIVQEESVDIRIVAEYVRFSSSIHSQIKENTKEYHKFWQESRSKLSILEIFDKAKQIEASSSKIDQAYDFLRANFPRSIFMESVLYSHYLLLIRGRPSYGLKIFNEKIQTLSYGNRKDLHRPLEKCLGNSQAIIMIIEKLGNKEIIRNLTKSVEFFGYPRSEIIAKGLDLIIPNAYRASGVFNIIDYVEKSQRSILGKSFEIYLKNNSKNLFLVHCYMSLIAGSEGLSYILTMDVEPDCDPTLICTTSGIIEAYTLNLLREMSYNPSANKDPRPELNVFELFDVQLLSDISSGVDSPKLSSPTNNRRPRGRGRTMRKIMSSKLSLDHQANEYLQLTSMEDCNARYTAKKRTSWDVAPNLILVLQKAPESEGEEIIPEEKMRKLKTIASKAFESVMAAVDSQRSNSSPSEYKDEVVVKRKKKFGGKETTHTQQMMKVDVRDEALEMNIYVVKESTSLNLISRGVISFIITAMVLSVGYLIFCLHKIEKIPPVLETVYFIAERHLNLWEWAYYGAIASRFLISGLFEDRQGVTALEFFQANHYYWKPINDYSSYYINEIIGRLPNYEPETKNKFFTPIRIRSHDEPSVIETADLFSLDRMMQDAGFRMSKFQFMNITDQDLDDPNLLFIINNVLDDQYIMEEYWFDVIKEDLLIKISSMQKFGEANCYFLLAFSIIVYVYIFIKESHFIFQRISFAEALNKIQPQELEVQLNRVSRFLELYENQQALVLLYEKFCKENAKKMLEAKKEAKERNFGESRIGTLNRRIYILLGLILIMEIMVLTVAYTNLVLSRDSQQAVKANLDRAVQASIHMNEMVTLSLGLYGYVNAGGENITMKNRPFDEVWNFCVTDIYSSHSFYEELLRQVDEDFAEVLNQHFTGDLCEIFKENCMDPIRPIAKNGAFALFTYLAQITSRLKSQIDQSGKTFADFKRIVYSEDYLNFDWTNFLFPSESLFIIDILQQQVLRTNSSYRVGLLTSVSCFVVGFLIFLLFIWGPIKKNLRDQRKQIYDMMKMIPFSVVKYNISVKTFWSKFSSLRD